MNVLHYKKLRFLEIKSFLEQLTKMDLSNIETDIVDAQSNAALTLCTEKLMGIYNALAKPTEQERLLANALSASRMSGRDDDSIPDEKAIAQLRTLREVLKKVVKTISPPVRIGFIDIDGTLLLKNDEGERVINLALAEQIKQFDEVYLFTQRGMLVSDKRLNNGKHEDTVEYVVEALRKLGVNATVSTSLERFYENGNVGRYYTEKVKAFEQAKISAKPASSFIQEAIEDEITLLLDSPEMYERFCKAVHELKDKGACYAINDPQNQIKHGWNGLNNDTTPQERLKILQTYFEPNNRHADEKTKKDIIRLLLHEGFAITPLQDKIDQFKNAATHVSQKHAGKKIDFVVVDDNPDNLKEIRGTHFGDKQPVTVLAVDHKGNPLTSAEYRTAIQKGLSTQPEERYVAPPTKSSDATLKHGH